MKELILVIFVLFAADIYAACSLTTRTNYTAGQVLSASALNADFNQLVTKANDFTGECLTNSTIDLTTKPTGTLPVANGGTGTTVLTPGYAMVASGTTVSLIAPTSNGNVLTSNGTAWVSSPPLGPTKRIFTSASASTSILIPSGISNIYVTGSAAGGSGGASITGSAGGNTSIGTLFTLTGGSGGGAGGTAGTGTSGAAGGFGGSIGGVGAAYSTAGNGGHGGDGGGSIFGAGGGGGNRAAGNGTAAGGFGAGGGGCGGTDAGTSYGGGGGGGAAATMSASYAVVAGTTYPITIGIGGVSTAGGTGCAGSSGAGSDGFIEISY